MLEHKDEKSELTVKLKTEIDSDNKLKILSKLNQDEIIRSNESGVMSNSKEGEKEGTISCLKDDKNHLKHRKNCKIEDRHFIRAIKRFPTISLHCATLKSINEINVLTIIIISYELSQPSSPVYN